MGRPKKKLKTVPNISQRSTATNLVATTSQTPATNLPGTTSTTPAAKDKRSSPGSTTSKTMPTFVPEQYITPARENPQTQTPQTPQAPVHNLTTPSTGANHFRNFPPPEEIFPTSSSLPQRENHVSRSTPLLQQNSMTPRSSSGPRENGHESPFQNSQAPSHPSSHGHNFEDEDEEEAEIVIPDLQPDTLRALNALLSVPDRAKFVPLLSPDENTPNSTW